MHIKLKLIFIKNLFNLKVSLNNTKLNKYSQNKVKLINI